VGSNLKGWARLGSHLKFQDLEGCLGSQYLIFCHCQETEIGKSSFWCGAETDRSRSLSAKALSPWRFRPARRSGPTRPNPITKEAVRRLLLGKKLPSRRGRPFFIVARATPPAVGSVGVASKVSRFKGMSWPAIFDLLSLPGNRDRRKQVWFGAEPDRSRSLSVKTLSL
jgi:hypothetical protein